MNGWKRCMAAVLAAVLVVTGAPATAYAKERKTDFYPEVEKSGVDYSELEYARYDTTGLYALMEEIVELSADAANVDKVKGLLEEAIEEAGKACLMSQLAYINLYSEFGNEKWQEESVYSDNLSIEVKDKMYLMMGAVAKSPCEDALRPRFDEEGIEELRNYGGLTEEQKALIEKEQDLIVEYQNATLAEYTVSYQGREYTREELVAAYYIGKMSLEEFEPLYQQWYKTYNEVLGKIFLELVEVRKQETVADGDEDFTKAMYEDGYFRDYTPEECLKFSAAVKEYMLPVYQMLEMLYYDDVAPNSEVLDAPFEIEDSAEVLDIYLPQMSSELNEAWEYIKEHGFYDIESRETKRDACFSMALTNYKTPFIYGQKSDAGFYDFTSLIHEFGHAAAMFYAEPEWYEGSVLDLLEVHSQGLELLMLHYLEEVFGDEIEAIQFYYFLWMLDSIVSTCLYDEFLQYVFAEEELTLEKVNKKYCELAIEYGYADESRKGEEMYSWVEDRMSFETPFYHISYAVSAMAALDIWSKSQEDFYGTVDKYLELSAMYSDDGFQSSLEAVGLGNPLDEESVEEVCEMILTVTDLEARYNALYNTAQYRYYTIKSDDTLSKIARENGIADWHEILELNDIKNPNVIHTGDILVLPPAVEVPENVYIVQKEDCLYRIGKKLGIDWKLIAEWNGLEDPYIIHTGQELYIGY